MHKRLYTADVNIQADTLTFTYGVRREGEHAPSRATAEQKIKIKKISDLAAKVSKALSGCDISNLKTLGGTLYDLLIPEKLAAAIAPSQDALGPSQQSSRDNFVFYLLNPKIAWIPWELLYDGDAFLCRRFCVSRSLVKTEDEYERAQRRFDTPRQPGVMVLLGETSGLDTDKEISEILRILTPVMGSDRIVVRDAVNKQETVDHLKENYDICHFIGHGVFSARSRKDSGWRLRDGTVLTCSDIEGVKSPKAAFPRLIIANSCYSARSVPSPSGAQNYVTSLYRSFLAKGVPQYIGTIARIPDDVSRAFTSAFYTALASGKSVGDAVFQARETSAAGPGWGYYVHYGDPGTPLIVSTGGQHDPQASLDTSATDEAGADIVTEIRQGDKNIFRVTVDYDSSIRLLVEAGNYDWVSSEIYSAQFHSRERGVKHISIELIHFNKTGTIGDVLHRLDVQDLRPATLKELLAFGSQHVLEFHWGRSQIWALGSIVRDRDGRMAPCFFTLPPSKERHLVVGSLDFGIGRGEYYAAVRK